MEKAYPMKKNGSHFSWTKLLDECTNRYYWRMMIGGRLVLDSTFRLIAQSLYHFAVISYRLFELPAVLATLPLLRFFTNGCYAGVLLKRALTNKNMPKWDVAFNVFSALVFFGLGIAYLATSWAMQPLAVFSLILAANVWDFGLEIKGYIQRALQVKQLKGRLKNKWLSENARKLIVEEIVYLENQQRLQSWYMLNVILTLAAVGLTLFALFNPLSFIAVNLVYFSASTFLLTGIACIIHGQLQHQNDAKWALTQKTLAVETLSKSDKAKIHQMVHTHSVDALNTLDEITPEEEKNTSDKITVESTSHSQPVRFFHPVRGKEPTPVIPILPIIEPEPTLVANRIAVTVNAF